MTDYTDLIARLRGWARDIQEGSTAIWAMDQDLKEAADAIAALQAEVARLGQQTKADVAQADEG